jgi:AmmeMemoRadiSam system protein B
MAGPTDVPVRRPAVAGLFYPDDPAQCRATARAFLDRANPSGTSELSRRWIGGIVPHAGWICSGAIAAQTIAAVARSVPPGQPSAPIDVVVVFGAVHTPLPLERAVLDSFASWQLPGDAAHVARELRGRIRQASELFGTDDRFHAREHAVEVELPLVREALPQAAVLPVEVPLVEEAPEIGRQTAREVIDANLRAVFLASSDLTHYGPAYQFAPAGVGLHGLDWASGNDRRLLDLVERFDVERVVDEVGEHLNACGGGAIAAMMAACRELGATEARVLRHASSYQTLAEVAPQPPDNAVGYAAVVVG